MTSDNGIDRFGDLKSDVIGSEILKFHSKYMSQVLPFVIPRMVSGPDCFPHCRWRRGENVAWVSPMEFCSGFSRRVEASCRKDWNALPMIRSVAFKFTAEHTMGTLAPFFGKRNSATDTQAQD